LSCTTACTLLLALGVRLMLLAVVAEADVELDVVAEVMGIVMYDGVHIRACVGCAAGASCRWGCGRRGAGRDGEGGADCRVRRHARWRLCGVCSWCFFIGVAVADVELDAVAGVVGIVVWDGVFVALAWGVQLVHFVGLARR